MHAEYPKLFSAFLKNVLHDGRIELILFVCAAMNHEQAKELVEKRFEDYVRPTVVYLQTDDSFDDRDYYRIRDMRTTTASDIIDEHHFNIWEDWAIHPSRDPDDGAEIPAAYAKLVLQ